MKGQVLSFLARPWSMQVMDDCPLSTDYGEHGEIPTQKKERNEGEARGKAENHVGAGKEFERIAEEEATGEDKENDDGGEDGDSNRKEPEFKSAKEKECWKLYQKMLEKGVSVSFDTVLRGMLTPTEYRLRRNQLLSSC